VAELLSGELLQPRTMSVHLDPIAARRLLLQVHLRPPGLRRLLGRLVEHGLLVTVRPGDASQFGRYLLALPGPRRRAAA
jgi:hypothetical protein